MYQKHPTSRPVCPSVVVRTLVGYQPVKYKRDGTLAKQQPGFAKPGAYVYVQLNRSNGQLELTPYSDDAVTGYEFILDAIEGVHFEFFK